jgi:hypothetical protein
MDGDMRLFNIWLYTESFLTGFLADDAGCDVVRLGYRLSYKLVAHQERN